MLSTARLQAARPGLARPSRGRLVIWLPAAAPRSGDGGGQQRPALRRPKPRPPPPPADRDDSFQLGSPEQQQPGAGQPNSVPHEPSQRRPKPRSQWQRTADKAQPASPRRQQQPAAGQPGSRGSVLSGPQLTRQIQRAEASQQVVQLVQQAGQLCNAFHFSTAVNRIAKLQQQEQSTSNQAAFAALLACAEQHAAVLDHVAVVQTVYAGGVLQHRLTAEQQAAWQGRLVWAFGQRELKPNELSNGLWGWSKMGLPLRGQLAAAANVAIQQLAERMNSQNVANTMVAYANAGWQLDSTAAAALLQRLEQVLTEAGPQAVANSLWAASKLGLQLRGSLNAALLQRLEQMLPQAEPQAVANSLWAAAKLGLQFSDSLKAAFEAALWCIVPAANSHDLANILWACGILRWSPGGRILTAAVAAIQRLIASGDVEPQHVNNFLWGLAELLEQGVKLPGELHALLSAAADWAGSRWGQLSAFDVVDLCFNLARLGHQPGSDWIDCSVKRCLECIGAKDVAEVRFTTLVWACSSWGHRLQRSELEQLVPVAADPITAGWEEGGRGGALQLAESLARQGFLVGPDRPAATAALEGGLLPLVCADIDLVVAGRLHPEKGELAYLGGWAAILAAIGLRLPQQQLEALCSYVGRHKQQLNRGDRKELMRAFEAWGHQPGLALLGSNI